MFVRPFSVRLRRPLSTARGDISMRRGLLVRVDVDGSHGVGEATPLPGWTESYDACVDALDAVAEPVATLEAARRAEPTCLDGAPAARHAVSLAVADARARAEGRSLARSLATTHGATATPATRVPVNATVGDGSPEETATAARSAVEDGFGCVKLKVGVGTFDRDVSRLQATRAAVGPDVELRADANGAYSREEARQLLESVVSAEIDLAYLEQPLSASDLAGHARLRELVGSEPGTPDVAVDESLASHDVEAVLDAGAADVLVCKPMALGGPDRVLEVGRLADDGGVDVVLTTTIDAVVARAGAVHVAAALDGGRACGLATGSLLETDLVADPAPVEHGEIAVPSGPGLAGDAFEHLFERVN